MKQDAKRFPEFERLFVATQTITLWIPFMKPTRSRRSFVPALSMIGFTREDMLEKMHSEGADADAYVCKRVPINAPEIFTWSAK